MAADAFIVWTQLTPKEMVIFLEIYAAAYAEIMPKLASRRVDRVAETSLAKDLGPTFLQAKKLLSIRKQLIGLVTWAWHDGVA